uniref:G-protein coupled receptors family 1 profile domain-containing protein n=1 Tax=Panagrolaimus superbus TaxID=310955 RepID=A0A914YU13_9BILA
MEPGMPLSNLPLTTMASMLDGCKNATLLPSRPLTAGSVDYIIQHYIFPIQFIFGVCGNSLNLLVLLSSSMKNQANTFLSAMAFADLAFLFCMVPFSLASFEPFYANGNFKNFLYLYRAHGIGVANMFSTAATWLVLAVSIERFSGVRRPMHTRFQLRDRRLLSLIGVIFLVASLLTLYQQFEYRVVFKETCGKTTPNIAFVHSLHSTSTFLRNYIKFSKYTQICCGVVLPVLAVAGLNVSLIYFLRRREIIPRATCGTSKDKDFRRTSDFGTFQRQERKVTATVLSIVTCFSITHLPSLVPYFYELFMQFYIPSALLNNTIAIVNSLLVSGKVLNFVLFCTSSTHFRRRTMMMLNSWFKCTSRRKKYSSMTSTAIATAPQSNLTITTNKKQQPIQMHTYRKREGLAKLSTVSSQAD